MNEDLRRCRRCGVLVIHENGKPDDHKAPWQLWCVPIRQWTGPYEIDLAADRVSLRRRVPPERWPFGLPEAHEMCCTLWCGGLYCDCKASDASDDGGDHGVSP